MQATITVLPGDGIGPEVVAEGVRALRAVAERWGHRFELSEALVGGCAIDECGSALPDDTLSLCRASDAVLLGAVGGPRWDNPEAPVRPEQALFALRGTLELFANLRPITVHPELVGASPLRPELLDGVDLLIVRELAGGIYFGERAEPAGARGQRSAHDMLPYTEAEVRRIVRLGFELAQARRKRLTSVDKANVMASSRLWRLVVDDLRPEFPDVEVNHQLVDSAA